MRFTRLLQKAEEVFGDMSAGRTWLMSPQRALGGAKPFDYASTEVGALEVDRLLGRIDYGVYS
jgi:putative toxin-antitoxin system antitoxin component (TIGR02293 family)